MSGSNQTKREKIKSFFENNPQKREVILYMLFTFLAFVCDLITRLVCDLALSGMNETVKIWIFPEQAKGTLLAFLTANVVAKVVSFILNRKKTFQANNSRVFSVVSYMIMSIVFIIIETIIGAPLQNSIYKAVGGTYTGSVLTTSTALRGGLYQFCGTCSQIIYGLCDFVAAFFLEKYIIMKRTD